MIDFKHGDKISSHTLAANGCLVNSRLFVEEASQICFGEHIILDVTHKKARKWAAWTILCTFDGENRISRGQIPSEHVKCVLNLFFPKSRFYAHCKMGSFRGCSCSWWKIDWKIRIARYNTAGAAKLNVHRSEKRENKKIRSRVWCSQWSWFNGAAVKREFRIYVTICFYKVLKILIGFELGVNLMA